ncbi:YceI family protein [Polaribacter haliotis]|uniref:YceI family protein n=1 Tax=Polaribacter haliotis TaxID=1888915 RepID=A0A7L8AIK3_9FLAO|nr:YceI family protein [Polaribacter haliotis]QOD61774.1 YceI family protein [Polaribacter haliotis]
MQKNILILIVFFISFSFFSQDKYYTKSGEITFESSVPSFEEVKAENTKVTAILKNNGEIAVLALTKGFRFKISLMEEHFNENYIESDKFPKAKFTGEIINFDANSINIDNNYQIKGNITLHGIEHEVIIKANIKKSANVITLVSNFKLKPEDFNIKIPNIVRKKIAQEVDVYLNFQLLKK